MVGEFFPIKDYSDKKFTLEFVSFELGESKYDEHYAKANKLSLEVPLRAMVRLTNKTLGSKNGSPRRMVWCKYAGGAC
jgi:DNA-directed RNA polymerase beta subunit